MAGKKYNIDIGVNVSGESQVTDLNEDLAQTSEEQDNVNEGFTEMSGTADKALGGIVGTLATLKTSIMTSVKSLGLMKVALAATGLGALLLVIGSIKSAFEASEEGQNKFRKIMDAIGAVTGVLIDYLSDFGEMVIAAFENPQAAMEGFWAALKANVVERFESLLDMFGLLAKAIKQVFEGDFSGAMDSAKQAGKEYVDVLTGIPNTLDKAASGIETINDRIQTTINKSSELSDLQSSIDKKERELTISRAEREAQIAEIRFQLADRERTSIEDRIRLAIEAQAISDSIFADEEKLAADRLKIIQERNALSKSNKDDLQAEAEAEANLIRIQTERSNAAKRLITEQVAAERELKAQRQADRDEEAAFQAAFDEQQDADMLEYEKRLNKEVELERKAIADKQALYQKDAENQRKAEEQKRKNAQTAVMGAMATTAAALSLISDLYKDDFEKQKKVKIASATINTIQGMIAAYMGGVATIPVPAPAGVALGIAMAAVVGLAGFANIQKIRNSNPGGGGGGGGGMGGGGAPSISSAPSLSLVSPLTTGEEALAGAIGQETEPTKAYVVSEDMSSQQALDRRISQNATI